MTLLNGNLPLEEHNGRKVYRKIEFSKCRQANQKFFVLNLSDLRLYSVFLYQLTSLW